MLWRRPCYLLLLRLARSLPGGFAAWLGGQLGYGFGCLPGRDQSRCRAHLARAYPDCSPAWVRQTARKTFRHFGRMFMLTLVSWHLPPALVARRCPIEGRDNFLRAARLLASGQGLLGLSGHMGNWELLARQVGAVLPTTVLGQRLKVPEQDTLVRELRAAHGNHLLYQEDGILACLRELRRGRLLATLPDQDIGRLAGAFVPWFGHPAYTPTGPAMLALMAGAPVQPYFCLERRGYWVIHVGPIWWPLSTGDRKRDAALLIARFTAYQESLLRRSPWQWAWWHKRWRHRPEDKPEALVVDQSGELRESS